MAERQLVYIGNYTRAEDAAIYHGEIDNSTGAITLLGKTPCEDNPSYLSLHPTGKYLYAVSETNTHDGGGAVSSFAVDADSGALTPMNLQPTGGSPCHNTVDASGQFVLSANYGGGSVAMHPIASDGSLGEMADFKQHEGSSVTERQSEPHAHSINVDPANKRAYCADLGLDKVLVYKVNKKGKLKANDPPFAKTQPGGGPRHLNFHPSGKFAYVNLEMTSKVTVFAHDGKTGALNEIQTVSTLPKDFTGNNSTAEIRVHPNGKFVYCSNRGHDSIAVFAIDEKSGKLTLVEREPSGGKTPRNFCIDPSGAFLLVANQNTNNVVVFRIDRNTGSLSPTGSSIESPKPVCVRFVEVQ